MMWLATQRWSANTKCIHHYFCRLIILQLHHLSTLLMMTSHTVGNQTILHQPVNCSLLVTQKPYWEYCQKSCDLQESCHNYETINWLEMLNRSELPVTSQMTNAVKLKLGVEKAPQSWQIPTKWQHLFKHAAQSHLVSRSALHSTSTGRTHPLF